MQWTTVIVLLAVVAMVTKAAKPTSEEKAARQGERETGRKNRACKYDYRAATCDQASNKMVAPLIAAESPDTTCEPTRTLRRACNDKRGRNEHGSEGEHRGRGSKPCKYDYKAATCDQASNKMVAPLIAAESTSTTCEPTRTLSRACNEKRCRYNYRDACKAASSGTMVTAQLVADRSDATCPATKEFECRQRNRGNKGQ